MSAIIQCKDLRFSYGEAEVLHGINFEVHKGQVVGLLGKNGAGKSTTINILMGFLSPDTGKCSVFDYPSHNLPEVERRRIGLLHEGFTQYDFMTIEEIERFYSAFYPSWNKNVYYELIDRMNVPYNRKVTKLSCGQRSQVTLGLILAQQAELLILDDYSLGLDVGYRRLFIDYLRDYVKRNETTVLLTSHVVAEVDEMLDSVIVVQKGNIIANNTREEFLNTFKRYDFPINSGILSFEDKLKEKEKENTGLIVHFERTTQFLSLFSRASEQEIGNYIKSLDSTLWAKSSLVAMNVEDAFVGITGRY